MGRQSWGTGNPSFRLPLLGISALLIQTGGLEKLFLRRGPNLGALRLHRKRQEILGIGAKERQPIRPEAKHWAISILKEFPGGWSI